jgi:hypothetical protein
MDVELLNKTREKVMADYRHFPVRYYGISALHSIMLRIFFLFAGIFSCWTTILAQRNAEEENICAPFLTSRNSSPLLKNLRRNISYDENAEFSCQLVLQDVELPLQIRVTVHEGLYNLALRHIEQGYSASTSRAEKSSLLPREEVAFHHAKSLARILLKSCDFQYNAGMWAMHPMLSRPDEAISYFENCLIGPASEDKVFFQNPSNVYDLYRRLIKAYNNVYNLEKAKEAVHRLLQEFPFDLEMKFVLELLTKETHSRSHDSTATTDTTVNPSSFNEFIETMIAEEKKEHPQFYNRYHPPAHHKLPPHSHDVTLATTPEGTTVPIPDHHFPANLPAWKVLHYHEMITKEVFQKHVEDRQPFILSLNDSALFDVVTGWSTSKWFANSKAYLKEKIGEEVRVMTESLPYSSSSSSEEGKENKNPNLFGLGINVQREYQSFKDLLQENFEMNEKLHYLNIQPDGSGEGIYRPPLHLLKDDLPIPSSSGEDHDHAKNNHSLLEVIASNLTVMNLWMGSIPANLSFTQSRLHRDATDNLYFLYEGKKKFYLWNPLYGEQLKTINPVIGINEGGLTYHWNINKFRKYFESHLKEQNQTLIQFFLGSSSLNEEQVKSFQVADLQSNEYFVALDNLLTQDVEYDLENVHFSKFNSIFSPLNIDMMLLHGNDPITAHRRQDLLSHSPIPFPEYVVELEAGDIFYLPTGYYHEVFSYQGDHTAMNLWWKPLNWKSALNTENEMSEKLFQRIIQEISKQ